MEPVYIHYYQSPAGLIKIGGNDTVISEIKFVDSQEEGPPSEVLPDVLRQCTEQLIEYFAGARRRFDIPINQEGTEFQEKIWSKLSDIPYGRTISYMDLAKRLGDTKKVTATATSTNTKNRIALVIPCHRVVGSSGNLVGYVGGVSKKRWLLDHESKIANGLQTLF